MSRGWFNGLLGLLLACAALMPSVACAALAERRIALVIGNSSYQHAGQLANPANDANAVVTMLKAAGFASVEVRRDLGIAEMRRVLGDFSEAARDADMALLFYAGHGIEVDGTNYLIPIDARLARDFDVEDEAISLDRVLRAIEPAKRLRFVMLDACRDNPFLRTMKRVSRSVGRGLARIEPTASDTLVAFATEAGTVAADGDKTSSPFTEALLRHLATPGLDVRIAFGRVRDDVMQKTSNRQRPFIYGSLGGSTVSLVDATPEPPKEALPAPPLPQAATPDPCAIAEAHWRSAEAINSKFAYEDHISRFPTCTFAGLAAARVAALDKAEQDQAAADQRKRAEGLARKIEEQHEQELAQARRRAAEAEEGRRRAEAERKRVAALPPPAAGTERERPARGGSFDGKWSLYRSASGSCHPTGQAFTIRIAGGVVHAPGGTGSISPSGAIRFPGRSNAFSGTLRGSSGSGTYSGRCSGTFTATRG
jgi:uncharacterized caspase-like protein